MTSARQAVVKRTWRSRELTSDSFSDAATSRWSSFNS
jgi:hypothetical protein